MIIFRKRLKETRHKKGLTQSDLGAGIFLSKQEVCLYERGKRTPPIDVLIRIAEFLEVDFLWLIGMELKYPKEENRIVNLSLDDIKIIETLKKDSDLYEKFLQNPERVIADMSNRLRKK